MVKNKVVRTDLGLIQQPQHQPDISESNHSSNPDHEGSTPADGQYKSSNSNASDDQDQEDTAIALAAAIAGIKGGDPSHIPLEYDILDPAVDALCLLLTPTVSPGLQSAFSPAPGSVTGAAAGDGIGDDSDEDSESDGGWVSKEDDSNEVSRAGTQQRQQQRRHQQAIVGGDGGGGPRDEISSSSGGGGSSGGSSCSKGLSADMGRHASFGRGSNGGSVGMGRGGCAPPRKHHLVLRLCGKVLASLARPPANPDDNDRNSGSSSNGTSFMGTSPEKVVSESSIHSSSPYRGGAVEGLATVDEEDMDGEASLSLPRQGSGGDGCDGCDKVVMTQQSPQQQQQQRQRHRQQQNGDRHSGEEETELGEEARGGRQDGGVAEVLGSSERSRQDTVLRRVGEALASAAEAVVQGMSAAEGASIVAFEEEVR